MARRGTSDTLAEDVHRVIRAEILAGRLEPGQGLRPSELSKVYNASISVIREALTRLVEQRLVVIRPNRGFNVTTLSRDDLNDLITVRILNETTALRLATEHGDTDWQADVLAAHHRLVRTEEFDPHEPLVMREEWAEAHASFHMALLEGCGNGILVRICRELFDAAELYRRWAVPSTKGRRTDAEHRAILNAVLDGQADLAVERYEQHVRRTANLLLSVPTASAV